jgi:MFS family permease
MLGVHVCYWALSMLVNLFLIGEILDFTDGNFGAVGLFKLIYFVVLAGVFVAFSFLVKRISRVWCVRMAAGVAVLVVILVMLFDKYLAQYYLLFGVAWGISAGMYWASSAAIEAENIGAKRMSGFMGWFQLVNGAVSIIFPLTLGSVIEWVDFWVASAICAAIGMIMVGMSFILAEDKGFRGRFSARGFVRAVREKKMGKKIAGAVATQFVFGIAAMANICSIILVALTFESSFDLGMFTSIFAASGMVAVIVYKLIKNERAKWWAGLAAAIICVGGAFGLLIEVSVITVLLFKGSYATFSVVQRIESRAAALKTMRALDVTEFAVEYNSLIEFTYLVARVVCMGVVILAWHLGVMVLFSVLVVVQCGCLVGTQWLLRERQRCPTQTPQVSV